MRRRPVFLSRSVLALGIGSVGWFGCGGGNPPPSDVKPNAPSSSASSAASSSVSPAPSPSPSPSSSSSVAAAPTHAAADDIADPTAPAATGKPEVGGPDRLKVVDGGKYGKDDLKEGRVFKVTNTGTKPARNVRFGIFYYDKAGKLLKQEELSYGAALLKPGETREILLGEGQSKVPKGTTTTEAVALWVDYPDGSQWEHAKAKDQNRPKGGWK